MTDVGPPDCPTTALPGFACAIVAAFRLVLSYQETDRKPSVEGADDSGWGDAFKRTD